MSATIINLIALPNPRLTATGKRVVTVLVAPRLAGGPATGRLDQYTLGQGDAWPTRVESASFTVQVNGAAVAATLLPEERDDGLWDQVFPFDLPVIRWVTEDPSTREVVSFPATRIANDLLGLYTRVAQQGADHPRLASAIGDELRSFAADVERVRARPIQDGNRWYWPQLSTRAVPYFEGMSFYTGERRTSSPPIVVAPPATPVAKPVFDFHQLVAALSDHPVVLRRLGLVFDLELADTASIASTGQLWVEATLGAGFDVWRPRSRYELAGGRFVPQARPVSPTIPPLVAGGYLQLRHQQPDPTGASVRTFSVTQVDVDGAMLKAINFANALRNEVMDPRVAAPETTTLPSLRTGGLTILQQGRKDVYRAALGRVTANASPTADLWADDLTRGYRVDVQVDGAWRSLHERVGSITVAGAEPVAIPPGDEGFLKAGAATSWVGDDALRLHEAIAGWDGWSLSARKPGRSIVATDDPANPEVPEEVDSGDASDRIRAEYQARPRSLPRLRFGKRYRFRLRAVDLAGGGLPLGDADTAAASDEVRYQRYEPVAAPVLVPRTPITEAESLEHLVIRSTTGQTPEQYATANPGRGYLATNERHVLAPKASLAMAEAHSKLDAALASPDAARTWFGFAAREAGTLFDSAVTQLREHPAKGGGVAAKPARRGDPLGEGQYLIAAGADLPLPWLPDPLAVGVRLWDPTSGLQISRDFATAWPNLPSLRLVLMHGTGAAAQLEPSATDARAILCKVPPGRRVTLRYATRPDATGVEHLAFWSVLDGSGQALARLGQHWMLTPYREVMLVHAVQRPVKAVTWAPGTAAQRWPGATAVGFTGELVVDGPSTSHIDVRARWNEVIDLPDEPAPREEPREADAFRLAARYEDATVPFNREVVVHQREATMVGSGSTARTELVPTPVSSTTVWSHHELGDTRHRTISYEPVGTTRYQEYFPVDVIKNPANLTTPGQVRVEAVKSTARPEAPRVAYVVPMFGWTHAPGAATRRGGLRVYLERPWFSSGDGERLAVLTARPGVSPAARLVSRWGRDPVWQQEGGSLPALTIDRIRGARVGDPATPVTDVWRPRSATRVLRGEAVRDADGAVVDLAGIAVEWCAERRMWFADIDLDPGTAYWPMVTLALARWQPTSLAGYELSAAVRAQFAQVAPNRAATVSVSGASAEVRVTGITAGNILEWLGDRIGQGCWYDDWGDWPPPRPGGGGGGGGEWVCDPAYHGTPGAGHRVRARVEKRPAGASDLDWTPVGDWTELGGNWTVKPEVRWAGTVPLPAREAGHDYRVLVAELEVYSTDASSLAPGTVAVDMGRYTAYGVERIVFAAGFPV